MNPLLILIFALGYSAIVFEHILKINKAAVALFMAVVSWALFSQSVFSIEQALNHHLIAVSQILFFLLGAMTIVELIDSHHGFEPIVRLIRTRSKRAVLWLVGSLSFFLSAVLDNLTTTILMVSLLKKVIPTSKERMLFSCLVVIGANAGGAWTPIGDVTTTMLWIKGQLSTSAILKNLFLPSLVSLIIPLIYFTFSNKGQLVTSPVESKQLKANTEPGAALVLALGVGSLIAVPVLKSLVGLPPFMGVLMGLSLVWLFTDFIHRTHEQSYHLKVSHIFTKIDLSSLLFFLGILLAVGVLDSAHLLEQCALWLGIHLPNLTLMALLIGVCSAVIDNIPLVAATMGMYPLDQFGTDHPLWLMIAYAAGTGGSLFIIGSSSGVALMGMEKIDFISYAKEVSAPAFIGYLAGMGTYLLIR